MSKISEDTNRVVDINALVRSMTHELDYYWSLGEVPGNGENTCVIYKIQQHIRMVDALSYEPCVVSMGPYHHGAPALQAMQKEKWSYLDYVINMNSDKTLLDYLRALEEPAKLARNCYSEEIKMNGEEFLQMLLLDGCFVLVSLGGTKGILEATTQVCGNELNAEETLLKNGGENTSGPDDVNEAKETQNRILSREGNESCKLEEVQRAQYDDEIGQWFFKFVYHDLFLLENQIPFFIVKKIYELVAGDNIPTDAPATHEIAKFVENALRWFPKSIEEPNRPKDFHHLLHLCHMYFRPSQQDDEDNQCAERHIFHRFRSFRRKYLKLGHDTDEIEQRSSFDVEIPSLHDGQQLNRWRRAAQYFEAGVKFKKRKYDKLHPHSLLDIKFSKGAMEIPMIVIDEHTGTLFRNLVAFEQTCPQFGDDFTAYIVFLSQLVSMPEDVTLLARKEIILHHLDSDEMVSDLFTMLSKDVVFDFNGQYYLKSLCQVMENYYQSRLNRWIAWLWLNHFSNPWLGLAAFATVVVLICTIVQTIFGILAYVNPPGI